MSGLSMIGCLLAGWIAAAGREPVFDEAVAAAAIRANIERLGAYTVEFTRTDEKHVRGSTGGGGALIVESLPARDRSRITRTCQWTESPRSLSFHYQAESTRGGEPADVKFDGTDHYVKTPAGTWRRRLLKADDPGDRLDERDLLRRSQNIIAPVDLLFPRDGHLPRVVSPHVVVIPSGQHAGGTGSGRLVRSAQGPVEVHGTPAFQVDYEFGRWDPIDTKKYKEVGPAALKPDEWRFRSQVLLFRWWLDPRHSFLPIRTDVYDSSGKVVIERADVLEFKEVRPNTWLPVRGTLTHYTPVGTFASEAEALKRLDETLAISTIVTMEVSGISAGLSIPEARFRPAPDEPVVQPASAAAP